jgi:D-alanyl-D-alanine-carboxypeptidase/D-alanyl-D-alanine-endopeptidase
MRCNLRATRAPRPVALILALLVSAWAVAAQPRASKAPAKPAASTVAAAPKLSDSYRRLFATGAANGAYHDLAVGMIQGKEQQTWFFGNSTNAPLPDTDSAFEIGAATDVFTGILLAQAALEGKLHLNDPLRNLLRADFPWADSTLAGSAVVSLATQQSGLPALPANLFPADFEDPYAGYREADLLAFLANYTKPTPTHGISYSSLNGGLLGVLLARLYQSDFPTLLVSKILVPLGMPHTGFDDPQNLLAGHAFGQDAAHWHYGVLAGAAGLRSTLSDLMAFVHVNLQPETSTLRGALLLARQPRAEGLAGGVGLGWNVHELPGGDQPTWPVVWRASETGGFSTFIGFRTDRQQGLVLLANSTAELAPTGLAWLSDELPPPAPAATFVAHADRVARYAGLYRLLNGADLTVRGAGGSTLAAQVRGQPEWLLLPVAEDVYATNGGGAVITFVRNIDEISGLVLRSNGQHITAQRLSERAPRMPRHAVAIDAAKLADYAGDYALDDNILVRVSTTADGLTAQYTGSVAILMRAFAPDRFADADGTNGLTFSRDEKNRISGLVVELGGGERKAQPAHWRTP